MAEKVVDAAAVADGWVDALCQCNNAASHPGELCPERGDAGGTLTDEQQAAYKAARAQDIADAQARVAEAQATLAAMKGDK